jgi:hypothetical protein
MTNEQLLALLAFAVGVVALMLALPTSGPKLDGRQKYRKRASRLLEAGGQRTSLSPIHVALAAMFGGSVGSHGGHGAHDDSDGGLDAGDFDSGDSGGSDGSGD